MNYTYSIVVNGHTLVHSISLDKALQFVFMFTQLIEDCNMIIVNNETNYVVFDHWPSDYSFYDSWIANDLKEE